MWELTLGKMNCSTGLYHTPFTMDPVLMALKRAVTTASCNTRFTHTEFTLLSKHCVNLSLPTPHTEISVAVIQQEFQCVWNRGSKQSQHQLPPGCASENQHTGSTTLRGGRGPPYLLVQLEKLHCYVALQLRPAPAGKHPQPGDDHRMEDFEIQSDGRHIGRGEHRGVRRRHNLYLCILPCHWDGQRTECYCTDTGETYHSPDTLTASVKWWGTGASERGREQLQRRQTLGKATPSAVWGAGSWDCCLQSEPPLVLSVVS